MKKSALFILATSFFGTPAFAGPIDGSVWLIASKSCSTQNQPLAGKERVQFAAGVFAYIYQVSDSQDEICNQAKAYQRVIQTFSNDGNSYKEISNLMPQALRTACRNKQTGTPVSDKTEPMSGDNETLTLAITGDHGTAELQGSSSCIGGTLHFELLKK